MMLEEDVIKELLAIVNVRKGDDWGESCCVNCRDDPWHRRDDYEGSVARCGCVCHHAREYLGDWDNDPLSRSQAQKHDNPQH